MTNYEWKKAQLPLVKQIEDLFDRQVPERTSFWAKYLTHEEAELVSQRIHVAEEDSPEGNLLRYILSHLVDWDSPVSGVYDTLVLHDAFLTPIVMRGAQYNFFYPQSIVLGLREEISTRLDLSTPQKVLEAKALASFAFEAEHLGHPRRVLETVNHTKHSALVYKNAELKKLVLEYAGRVNDLMHYADVRDTVDPKLLRVFMEDSHAASLSSGIL